MAAHGTLSVRVFTARAQIPLEGATVAVTRKQPGRRPLLLSLQATDENGAIVPVPLPAPPVAESERPGGGTPFAVCDVWADHPDYELLVAEDVQVFAGVETLQEMALIPLPEHAAPRNASNQVLITPQPL